MIKIGEPTLFRRYLSLSVAILFSIALATGFMYQMKKARCKDKYIIIL